MPWIALLDPDTTTTATDGLYLVYLYTSAIDAVYLSKNQGATQHLRNAEQDGHKGRAAEQAAIAEIAGVTTALREFRPAAGSRSPQDQYPCACPSPWHPGGSR